MAFSTLSTLLPRLRGRVSAPFDRSADHFTADDVRRLLDPASAASELERRRAVLTAAAVPSTWTARLEADRAWELGRLSERLPTIVYLYASGVPLEEIGRRLGTLSALTAERALQVACACIARQLNDPRTRAARLVEGGSSW